MSRSLPSKVLAANAVLITARNFDAVDEFFAPGYVAHGTRRDLKGRTGVRRFLAQLLRAFPDLAVEVATLVAGKDRVAWQRTLRATWRGAYQGFPATGRKIVWRDMVTSRFRGGLLVEDQVVSDLAERLLLARKR
ncbi:MAG: ester cyclase [Planctomycetota bacterium]